MKRTHRAMITCPDDLGLVHTITGIFFQKRYNIISNHEFVDQEKKFFFMRTEFSAPDENDLDYEALRRELLAVLPSGTNIRFTDNRVKNLILFATKEHHCLADLVIRAMYGELPARICCVISNHNILQSFVEKFSIPFYQISHEGLTREQHEHRVMEILDKQIFDYIVLAKYMRVLSPEFVQSYRNQMINIHHSLLPAFIGASPYRQAFERGVKIIGATSHFVTEELDHGPIIAQNVTTTSHASSAAEMAQAGRDIEKIVLASAVKLVLEDRVIIDGNKTIVFE